MADEQPLKSAYELAMERLRSQDREAGSSGPSPLTAGQKEAIAEARETARAKMAELEILHGKNLAGAGHDPGKIAEIEDHYRIDRRRVESALESALARARRGDD